MYPVKQSATLLVPFFVHDSSGDAVTSATFAGTKRISKGSGAFAALTATTAELDNGWYTVSLTATHTNALGILSVMIIPSSGKQVNLQFRVEAKLNDDLNDLAATAIVSDGTALNTTAGVLDTVTANTDMRGTNSAALATALATAQSDLDKITGSDGATLATAQGNYAPNKVVPDVAGTAPTAAEINAEVVNVMKTDVISEMSQQAPPTTPTFEEALMYIYSALRNKIDVSATGKEFNNNAGTVIWKKSLTDDGTTYSEAKGVTGP